MVKAKLDRLIYKGEKAPFLFESRVGHNLSPFISLCILPLPEPFSGGNNTIFLTCKKQKDVKVITAFFFFKKREKLDTPVITFIRPNNNNNNNNLI